jgi:RNA polymerase sigma-70 factor (ECF subfamily)
LIDIFISYEIINLTLNIREKKLEGITITFLDKNIIQNFTHTSFEAKIICNSEDWDCVQKIIQGDYSEFDILMDKYQSMVYNLCSKYTDSVEEAEDFTQDIFLKVFESLSKFRGESEFSTWLYTISRNELKMKYRKSKKIEQEVSELKEESLFTKLKKWKEHITPEVELLKEEYKSKITQLVNKLPNNYKTPLLMYYFDNMSYKEISTKLNLKMNTLKSYIFRGKESLKKELESYEGKK